MVSAPDEGKAMQDQATPDNAKFDQRLQPVMLAPLLAQRLDRDPAIGSSLVLTFTTDRVGFFIFLGLATVFLL
jgi:hypothetical protein